MKWYWVVVIVIGAVALLSVLSELFYKQFFKRFYDIVLSGCALIVLFPLLLVLTIVGAVVMGGNPFFVQSRPGKISPETGKEKIFNLIKFRTMSNKKDNDGNLLPDEQRVNKYGKFIRSTSLDELGELINILKGDMSIVGPRPLLVKYLECYTEEQHHRHDVRPGLTGYAQAHGRNALSWEEKFTMDLYYTQNYSFFGDIKIIFGTVLAVLRHYGINSETNVTMEEFLGTSYSEIVG